LWGKLEAWYGTDAVAEALGLSAGSSPELWSKRDSIKCAAVETRAEDPVGGSALPGKVLDGGVADDHAVLAVCAPWEARRRSDLPPAGHRGRPGAAAGEASSRVVVGVLLDPATGLLFFALNPSEMATVPGGGAARACKCPKAHRAGAVVLPEDFDGGACALCKQAVVASEAVAACEPCKCVASAPPRRLRSPAPRSP